MTITITIIITITSFQIESHERNAPLSLKEHLNVKYIYREEGEHLNKINHSKMEQKKT